jgi:uncharacterized protein DUF4304
MDSKIVTREIRTRIWPALRKAGFDCFTGRTAWRHGESKIDVVNFQSFNSYLAEGVRCTTFSFALNLACFFNHIPYIYPGRLKTKNGKLLPNEYEGHVRWHLDKSLEQPELKRSEIWFIGENGRYFPEAIEDAKSAIIRIGLPWFERFNDLREVMRTLLADGESDAQHIGSKDSPIRHYLTGFTALALDNTPVAVPHLQQALDSGCFEMVENELRSALNRLDEIG